MRKRSSTLFALAAVTAALAIGAARAQTPAAPAAPAPTAPSPSAPAVPAPAPAAQPSSPAAPPPAATTPPAASAQPAPATPAATPPPTSPPSAGAPPGSPDAAMQALDLMPRPSVVVRGSANWDDGYKAITTALGKARAAALKAGLREGGRPIAAFVDTDDNGFKFEAMIPLDAAPTAPVDLGPDVKIGATPGGKALKFQHRGAYDDVDSTYEAITAYLDEKGYDALNVFVEEYLNDPKGPEDTGLALDIYVFIK